MKKANALGQIEPVTNMETKYISSPDLQPVSTQELTTMTAGSSSKGNFWTGLSNVLTSVAEAGKGVAQGIQAGKQTFGSGGGGGYAAGFTPTGYRAPQQRSNNDMYKTLAIIAGTGLVFFAIVKLSQN